MLLSRQAKSLEGTTVLALGTAIAVRIAAAWLADSGASVVLFRPGWKVPAPDCPEGRFEAQVSRNSNAADFERDESYDVVITDSATMNLLSSIPKRLTKGAAVIEITSPMGPSPTYSDSLTSDMALWARSGLGFLTREMDEQGLLGAPCLPLNRQPSILAGIAAATAAIAALLETGEQKRPARHIGIDQLELLAIMPMQPIAFAQLEARIIGMPQASTLALPGGTVETINGLAYVRPVEPDHWIKLLRLVGGLDAIADRIEAGAAIRSQATAVIDKRIRAWARELTSEDIADTCQAEHIPVAPVYRPDQVVTDAHLLERDFFRDDPSGNIGLNLPWLAAVGEPATHSGPGRRSSLRKSGSRLPLAGLRILDLSWAWAGPFATTLLSDLGAEVINVEWHPRASNLRRNPPHAEKRHESNNTAAWWSANQRGKFSIGINLKTPAGKRIVRDLAAVSDVVVENFSPGVVDRLGIGFDNLLEANPRLVYVSLSAFGQTGPRSHYIGYGTQVYAAAGMGYVTSQDGRTCSQMYIPYPDPVSGLSGAFAIAAFVSNARKTGRPARVDLSEVEAVAAVALEPLLDALAERKTDEPAPLAVRRYQVVNTADDHVVVLIAASQQDWQRFQTGVDAGSSSRDAIQVAAKLLNLRELLARTRGLGLQVELIAHSADVLKDPYLQARGFWIRDQSPEIVGSGALIGGSLWHVDGERTPIWRGAPMLFSDTRQVLIDLLGYASSDVDGLLAREVIAQTP